MKFADPYLLNLLWALIIVFGIMVYGILKRKKILLAFSEINMLADIAPGFDPKTQWVKAALITIAFAFAVVALAGPQLGYKWEKIRQKGVDIMIALDCSKSMLAQDIKPNRLERAKREIIDLMRMLRSDRAGLVAFSGKAILQCPLTLDHEAFNVFLKVLEPSFLPVGGTNLGEAIQTCYKGFEPDSDTEKAIIIITDGESTIGMADEIAQEMSKQGIKIFCIGVGDQQGAPIPDEKGGFKKDASGKIVLSKVDEKGLEKLAAVTGGTYVRSVAGDMDLDLIYTRNILGNMERKTMTSGKKKVWENRYQWFLFPCLILLLLEMMLPLKKRGNTLSVIIFAIGLSLGISQTNAAAQTVSSSVKKGIEAFEKQEYETAKKHFIDAQLNRPDDERLYYNIGVADYMTEAYDQALKNFEQAAKSEDINLRHDARYNLANTHFRAGNLDESIKGYEDVLKEFPDDTQAKENLEFVRKKKQEQQQQKNSKSDKNPEDQEKKEDGQENQSMDQDKNQTENQDKKQSKDPESQEKNKSANQDQQQKDQDSKGESAPGNKEKDTSGEKKDLPAQPVENQPADPENKPSDTAKHIQDNMLNRLEDKPGQAMMPGIQGQQVEKDW